MAEISISTLLKQFKNQLIALFLLIVFTLALALSLFFYNQEKLQQLQLQQLPLWQQQTAFIKHRFAVKQLFSQITSADSAELFLRLHQQILVHFQAAAALDNINENRFEPLVYQHKKILTEVKRLTQNGSRNHKYKLEALSLLRESLAIVDKQITAKNQRINILFKQIMADKLTDKVTKTRIKAYAQISQQLNELIYFKQRLQQLYLASKSLSLTTSLEDINQLSIIANQLFFSAEDKSNAINAILKGADASLWHQLRNIFVGDINLLAKWRGQIRLAENYYQQLKRWESYFDKPINFQVAANKDSFFTSIMPFIQSYIPQFSAQYFIDTIFVVLGLLIIVILLTLVRLQKRVAYYIKKVSPVVISNDKQVNEQVITADTDAINSIQLLQHHEAIDPQQLMLTKRLQNSFALLAIHVKVCVWQTSLSRVANAQQIVRICQVVGISDESKISEFKAAKSQKLWKYLFNKTTRLFILKQARLAKIQRQVQRLMVDTKQGVFIEIVISYQIENNTYVAIFKNNNEAICQREKLTQRQNQFSNYQYQTIRFGQQQQQQLLRLLTYLQCEFETLSFSEHSELSKINHLFIQINDLLTWQKAIMLFLANQYQAITPQITERLQLHSTHIGQDLICIAAALIPCIKVDNNKIDIIVDEDIQPLVILDTPLFKQFLLALSHLFFHEMQNETLQIRFKLQDKNIGQQIISIRFKLQVKQAALVSKLKKSVVDELDINKATIEVVVIRALCERLGIKEFFMEEFDNQLSLQCKFSLALTQDKQIKKSINFNQQHFVLIAKDDLFSQHIVKLIKSHQGFVSVKKDSHHFMTDYAEKILAKQAISTVILFKPSDHDLEIINQYLQSLASEIQPKLLVLQESIYSRYGVQGFYDLSSLPFIDDVFVCRLQQLLTNAQMNNQLITAQQCQPFNFQTSQIQVLLATVSIDLQMNFSRLLAYLGLQVTIVSNSQAMLQHWQTGKYLVLFTEFSTSPFIKLAVNESISRGVYSLNIDFSTGDDSAEEIAKNWHVKRVNNTYQLAELTSLLSPWLKPLTIHNKEANLRSTRHQNFVDEQTVAPINLQQYVNNQGSIDLAVIMLNEYVDQIQTEFTQLLTLLAQNKREQDKINILLKSLVMYCKIIAAEQLELSFYQLQQIVIIEPIKVPNQLVVSVKQKVTALIHFAQHL